jgi:hypothetical protein
MNGFDDTVRFMSSALILAFPPLLVRFGIRSLASILTLDTHLSAILGNASGWTFDPARVRSPQNGPEPSKLHCRGLQANDEIDLLKPLY